MVSNIVVVDVLTCYALLHSVYDLKTVQMNIQCNLIWELMLYEFELGHNAFETIKNICCAKDEGSIEAPADWAIASEYQLYSSCKTSLLTITSGAYGRKKSRQNCFD